LKTHHQELHKEIIELCIAGNAKAEYQLYKLYSGAMFNVCMRLLNTREEAEDALQEGFSEIFDKLKTYRFESTFGSWAKRVMINKCLNQINKKKPVLILKDKLPESPEEPEEPDYKDLKFKVQEVHKAIEKLPDGYRIVFSLFMFEGYDHAEIAQILNISESTSKSQYMKAKRKLKELITNQA
jgi:RNA polymerase sigma-70 factor, ECF subfamily